MIKAEVKSRRNEDISIMLTPDNHKWSYLCDCGEASGLSVTDCNSLNAIFISHTHIDHFINFDTIFRHQIGCGRKVVVVGPKDITKQVQARLKGYTWNLIHPHAITYEVREITDVNTITTSLLKPPHWNIQQTSKENSDIVFQNDVLTVTYTALDHKIPSMAYLFTEPRKINIGEFPFRPGKWIEDLKLAYKNNNAKALIDIHGEQKEAQELFQYLQVAEGMRVGVVMDHAASEENHIKMEKLFHQADELYIECFYREADHAYAAKNFHGTAKRSGAVARRAQVKKVIPVHFSRRYIGQTHELIEECLEEFNRTE